jgi:hypothetical protein
MCQVISPFWRARDECRPSKRFREFANTEITAKEAAAGGTARIGVEYPLLQHER